MKKITFVALGAVLLTQAALFDMAAPALAAPAHKKAVVSNAQSLWGGASVGMTREGVLTLYPSASSSPEGLVVQKQVLGRPTQVEFKFDGVGRLTQVTMAMMAGGSEVSSGMTKIYGSPVGCGMLPHTDIYSCRWRRGTLDISTQTISMGASVGTIIDYSRSQADNASF